MTAAPLKSLCQIRHGGTPSKANPAFWDGDVPWVSPKDMKSTLLDGASDHITIEAVENSATSLVPEKSILVVVRSGILAHSLPVAQATRPLTFNQDIKALMPDADQVDPDYLFWFVRSQEPRVLAQGVKKGATVHSVQSGFIENLQVPLPKRAEQRRIVDLLSRAEGIVRLRREAEKKAAELIPALFLDMFGDPATNPKGWEVEEFGSVITYSRYGPRFPNRDYAESGAHILRTTDMSDDGVLRWWESPIMSLTPAEVSKYQLSPKTLLITRTGTIGRVAMFSGASEPCIAGAYLLEFGLKELISPDYALAFFLSAYGQQHLLQGSRSVAQPNINAPTVMAIKMPIPPMGRQAEFSKAVEGVRAIQSQQSDAIAKAQATFDALLAQAFS